MQFVPCLVQIADIQYTSKADFAGSALHILHRGTNNILYLATAQATGLKLLLKVYDIGASSVCNGTLLHHEWMTHLVLFVWPYIFASWGKRHIPSLVSGCTLLHHGWQTTPVHCSWEYTSATLVEDQ